MTKYVTVKRNAKVGERILITNSVEEVYSNGDVLTVICTGVNGPGDVYVAETRRWVACYEYEVIIENDVKTTKLDGVQVFDDDRIAYNGAEYDRVIGYAKAGDIVLSHGVPDAKEGEYYKVLDDVNGAKILDDVGDSRTNLYSFTAFRKNGFSKGDVVYANSGHVKNRYGVITDVDLYDIELPYEVDIGDEFVWYHGSELELVAAADKRADING